MTRILGWGWMALWIVAIAVVLLRLFGFLYFASTLSNWAIVPAISLSALLAAPWVAPRLRRAYAAVFVLAYLSSVYFHGWADLMARLAEGQSGIYEGTEAACILLLGLLCWRRVSPSGAHP
jgi:hypothetical protein